MNEERFSYTLSDAAEILMIKENDLLQYGASEIIRIMVAVPEQLTVIPHQKRIVPGQVRISHIGLPTPLYLVLKPSYCLKVEANNETFQSEFPFGYYLADLKEDDKSVKRDLLPTYPDIQTDSMEDPPHVWVTIGKPLGSHCWENHIFENNGASPDIGSPVCINRSKLLIPRFDLNLISEKLELAKEIKGYPVPDDNEKVKGDVTRGTLLKLVLGMAMNRYEYPLGKTRTDVPKTIEIGLNSLGIDLTDDTIRKALKEAEVKHSKKINSNRRCPR